jgi:uncharacterized protein (DUF2062 family)
LLKLFKKEDAPARLAVGFALGAITNFYPTFGFGLPISIALAVITRTIKSATELLVIIYSRLVSHHIVSKLPGWQPAISFTKPRP